MRRLRRCQPVAARHLPDMSRSAAGHPARSRMRFTRALVTSAGTLVSVNCTPARLAMRSTSVSVAIVRSWSMCSIVPRNAGTPAMTTATDVPIRTVSLVGSKMRYGSKSAVYRAQLRPRSVRRHRWQLRSSRFHDLARIYHDRWRADGDQYRDRVAAVVRRAAAQYQRARFGGR